MDELLGNERLVSLLVAGHEDLVANLLLLLLAVAVFSAAGKLIWSPTSQDALCQLKQAWIALGRSLLAPIQPSLYVRFRKLRRPLDLMGTIFGFGLGLFMTAHALFWGSIAVYLHGGEDFLLRLGLFLGYLAGTVYVARGLFAEGIRSLDRFRAPT